MNDESPEKNSSYKSGFVALLGKPNVGKSTLLNHYIGQKIAAVSIKPQTTRKRQLGILTTKEAQIIFVDTPGLHSGDYKLSEFINQEARFALLDADLILFVVNANQLPDEEDRQLAMEVGQKAGEVKRLLVMNKVDLASPSQIAQHEQAYRELLHFEDSVRISAITASGREKLLDKVIELLPEGPQFYPEAQITTTYEREIAEDLIRSAALYHLRDEVPYAIFVQVNDYIKRQDGIRYVHATLFVERDSQKGIVIGKGGRMIKDIGTMARQEIEEMNDESVFLELAVKVEKNWRNNPDFLSRHGLSHDA